MNATTDPSKGPFRAESEGHDPSATLDIGVKPGDILATPGFDLDKRKASEELYSKSGPVGS